MFVVGLLDVENKRVGNRGNRGNITRKQQGHIVVVAVAVAAMQARRLLSACLVSMTRGGGTGATQGAATGAIVVAVADTTHLRNLRALRSRKGVRWCDGFGNRCTGSSRIVSHFSLR